MAKVAYGKLGLTKNTDVKTVEFNGQQIEVIQYLPAEEKMELFTKILSQSVDDNGYYNVFKINFFIDMEIIFAYTNISFTAKQKEDLLKLYDVMKGSGFIKIIKDNMNQNELNDLTTTVWETIKGIYEYQMSALGIMKTIAADYSDLNLEATDIQEKLADPNNLNLVRDILARLG